MWVRASRQKRSRLCAPSVERVPARLVALAGLYGVAGVLGMAAQGAVPAQGAV